MVKIDRLEKSQFESVLNRIIAQGPPEELRRFKNAVVFKGVCPSCGKEYLDFAFGRCGWTLLRVHESESLLVLESGFGEMAPAEFIAEMAELWPKLDFDVECWASTDGLTCNSLNKTSKPPQQGPTCGLN